MDAEHRAKLSAALKGRPISEAARAAREGRTLSAEHRANIAAATRRRFQDPEARAEHGRTMAAAATAEVRAKRSAALRGRTLSPEHRERMGAARRGVKLSDAHRARLSEAHMRGTDIKYSTAHYRARKALPRICEMADATCKGRLEVAFRHDAPFEFVRTDPDSGFRFYVGPDSAVGYQRLCASHHFRYDAVQ